MQRLRRYQKADNHQGGTFCPNCGRPVGPTAKFCGHCGYKLAPKVSSTGDRLTRSESVPQSATSANQDQPVLDEPVATTGHDLRVHRHRTRHPWYLTLIALVLLLVGGGYAWGRNYFAPANQLKRTVSSIKSNQKQVYQQFSSSDPSLKLSAKNIQPLLDHFKENKQSFANFQRQLQQRMATNDGLFEFRKTGKAWLLFDRYQIVLDPLYPQLTTNHSGVKLSINGKAVATSNKADYHHTFGPLVPGNYELSAVGTVNGHTIKNTNTYYVHAANAQYDLPLKTISFTVTGTPETKVYVNQEDVGTIGGDGELAVKEIPWSNQLQVTGKFQTDGTTVTSKPTRVSEGDDGQEVNVAFAGAISKSDAQEYFRRLFQMISSYTYSGDLADAKDFDQNLDGMFVDGTSNKDYKEFITMAKGYHDNDDIMRVDYDPEVITTTPAADGQCKVTYDVKYDFSNTKDDRHQVFRYTATLKKTGQDYQIVKISAAKPITDTRKTND